MLSNIPMLVIDKIWHVGFLKNKRESLYLSFEGDCLSASTTPKAWCSIAKLRGDFYELSVGNYLFVDAFSFLNDTCLKHHLIEYGLSQGLIEWCSIFHVSWYDDEAQSTLFFSFFNIEEALVESDDNEIVEKKYWVATEKLKKETGFYYLQAHNPFEALIVHYFNALPKSNVAGVFFKNKFEPENYSAPRFAVFQKNVDKIASKKILSDEVDDLLPESVGNFKTIDF